MSGREFKAARRRLALSQTEVAERLGVSQPYVALVEAGRRRLPQNLVRKAVRTLRLSPTALPLEGLADRQLDSQWFAQQFSALGYPGFAYMRANRRRNPSEVLLAALSQQNLEARVCEGLVWVLLYYEMDTDWLVPHARLRNLSNRLGFLVSLAKKTAEQRGGVKPTCYECLTRLEEELRPSRLAREDTFCQAPLSLNEREWLSQNRSSEAAEWNVLSDLRPEHLQYA